MPPSTMKQWVITGSDKGFDGLQVQDAQVLKLSDHDVLVKLHAASLNYRDLAIAKVTDAPPPFAPTVLIGQKSPVVLTLDGGGGVVAG